MVDSVELILDKLVLAPGRAERVPHVPPDFLSALVAWRNSCGFPNRKPHTRTWRGPRAGNPGRTSVHGTKKTGAALPTLLLCGQKYPSEELAHTLVFNLKVNKGERCV